MKEKQRILAKGTDDIAYWFNEWNDVIEFTYIIELAEFINEPG